MEGTFQLTVVPGRTSNSEARMGPSHVYLCLPWWQIDPKRDIWPDYEPDNYDWSEETSSRPTRIKPIEDFQARVQISDPCYMKLEEKSVLKVNRAIMAMDLQVVNPYQSHVMDYSHIRRNPHSFLFWLRHECLLSSSINVLGERANGDHEPHNMGSDPQYRPWPFLDHAEYGRLWQPRLLLSENRWGNWPSN